MHLIPSDPDIRTVFGRIKDQSLDLQPDFQRGEVWSLPKQKLLIDSILRTWYVPPIHVVRIDEDTQVVLDGQQRLRSIEHFMLGRFAVDGKIEPADLAIAALGGLRYDQLPPKVRGRIDRFTLRIFVLTDYKPEEPSELFFRLNQPATLTEAEKRNAFFGHARKQVRELTELAQAHGMSADRIGFSSARLAYEDVVARFIWTIEAGTLAEKATASRVTARYRTPEPFLDDVVDIAAQSLVRLFSVSSLDYAEIRLNKATTHSWLLYLARAMVRSTGLDGFDAYFEWFERGRHEREAGPRESADPSAVAFDVFNDRATARVNDVSSVLLRDSILWALKRANGDLGLDSSGALWAALQDADGLAAAEARVLHAVTQLEWANLR